MAKENEAPDDERPDPKYREFLVLAAQKSQDSFDKALLTLSGGALGISIVFLKDIVGDQPVECLIMLIAAWLAWGSSLLCVVASFQCSNYALRETIRQCDDGSIYTSNPGGWYAPLTRFLNVIGGLLFIGGVAAMLIFVALNLSARNDRYEQIWQHKDALPTPDQPASAPDSRERAQEAR